MPDRYIGNAMSGVYHDRQGLTERCNTDDLVYRVDLAERPPRGTLVHPETRSLKEWQPCRWCGGKDALGELTLR